MKFLGGVVMFLTIALGSDRNYADQADTLLARSTEGITLADVVLCTAPSTPCTPVTEVKSRWRGCAREPGGCSSKTFEMLLPAGQEISVRLQTLASSESNLRDQWAKVSIGYFCNNVDCWHGSSGWVQRSKIALLSEFRRMRDYPIDQQIGESIGDWGGTLRIRRDATFSFSDGEKIRRGTLYRFRNILWVKFNDRKLLSKFLIENEEEKSLCWSPDDDRGCVRSPFSSTPEQRVSRSLVGINTDLTCDGRVELPDRRYPASRDYRNVRLRVTIAGGQVKTLSWESNQVPFGSIPAPQCLISSHLVQFAQLDAPDGGVILVEQGGPCGISIERHKDVFRLEVTPQGSCRKYCSVPAAGIFHPLIVDPKQGTCTWWQQRQLN